MADQMLNVLIEGYDPEKALHVQDANELLEQDWRTVYGSRQNGSILQAELVALEETQYTSKSTDKKLCGIIHIGHIKGLIPLDFLGCGEDVKEAQRMIGTPVAFVVAALDREAEIFVGNRQTALDVMASATLRKIREEQTVMAVVRRVFPNNLVVDLGGITSRLSSGEVSHGYIDNLRNEYKEGDHVNVKIKKINAAERTVEVSIKDTLPNYWQEIHKFFNETNTYVAKVSGISEFGTFVEFKPGVSGLAPHLRHQQLKKGDKVLARILAIKPGEKKINAKIVKVF